MPCLPFCIGRPFYLPSHHLLLPKLVLLAEKWLRSSLSVVVLQAFPQLTPSSSAVLMSSCSTSNRKCFVPDPPYPLLLVSSSYVAYFGR